MDNPQHYQPLSHALHPPATSTSTRSHYAPSAHYSQPQKQVTTEQNAQEEEEEEEDDDDEGLVEEQLNRADVDMHGSGPSSPKGSTSADAPVSNNQPQPQQDQTPSEPGQKRRPGRPRGSKNRRPRVGSAKHETTFSSQTSGQTSTPSAPPGPPSHPNITPQNQLYYEFQWRVLNLCAEFYGAAEELVKGTSPVVVAQCYQMGPGVKVDPLYMLGEAKRVCDTLLANPSQLVTNPPAPVYPVLPTVYQPTPQPQSTPVASSSAATPTAVAAATAASVITGAQSFVVPLGHQAPYPQYVYGSAPGQYTTTPYYQYPYGHPAQYYPQPMPAPPHPVPPQPVASTSTAAGTGTAPPTATITTTPSTGGTVIGNQGSWSDEEEEKLKKLANESKAKVPSGEIDWDWVIQEWGISRTRHQILIRATQLGLKESSTRATKRRREDASSEPVMASLQATASNASTSATGAATTTNTAMQASTSSPAQSASHSLPGSTPAASPAMQNLHVQRPGSSKGTVTGAGAAAAGAPKMPWPMPTVAASTVPSIAPTASTHDQQRSSYYRPRPTTGDSAKSTPTPVPQQQPQAQHNPHHYIYGSNGQAGSYRPKENGK